MLSAVGKGVSISQTNQCAVVVAIVVGLRVVGGENVMNHFTATIKTCIYTISTHTKQNVRFLVVFTERMLLCCVSPVPALLPFWYK